MEKRKIDWDALDAYAEKMYQSVETQRRDGYGMLFRIAALRLVFTKTEIRSVAQKQSSFSDTDFEIDYKTLEAACNPAPGRAPEYKSLDPETRKKVLTDFGAFAPMIPLLPKDAIHDSDLKQRYLAAYITGKPPDIEKMDLDELSALSQAVNWLEAYKSEGVPSREAVRARYNTVALTASFEAHTRNFIGRKAELKKLDDFMTKAVPSGAMLPDFTLMVHGPGGTGKTTLLSKFILHHIESAKASNLLFVYLDFDRPDTVLDPKFILSEIARQIEIQDPGKVASLSRLKLDWDNARGKYAMNDPELGPLTAPFFKWVENQLLKDRLFLLVFDSFEIIHHWIKPSEIDGLERFLTDFQRVLPALKVIFSGRDKIEFRVINDVEIKEFDEESALAYMRNNGVKNETCARTIFQEIGGNPLDLKLAAREALKTECADIRETLKGIEKERRTQVLYGRQLDQIGDERVKKLAKPGLLVRTVNAEIIQQILAGPCELGELTTEEAEDILDAMRKEAFLIKLEEGVWKFRQEFRGRLHRLVASEMPDKARQIHNNAVRFYEGKPSAQDRAEWIFHRLQRGDDPHAISEKMLEGTFEYLKPSIEELLPDAQAFLSEVFGFTLPEHIRYQVTDLLSWERNTARRIGEAFLSGDYGQLERVAPLLSERPERSKKSPLQVPEALLLAQLGETARAISLAEEALRDAQKYGVPNNETDAAALLAIIHEREGHFEQALEIAETGLKTALITPLPLYALRLAALRLRIGARTGPLSEKEASLTLDRLDPLDFSTVEDGQLRPFLEDILPERFFTSEAVQKNYDKSKERFSLITYKEAVLLRLLPLWKTGTSFFHDWDMLKAYFESIINTEFGFYPHVGFIQRILDLNLPDPEFRKTAFRTIKSGKRALMFFDLLLFAEKEDIKVDNLLKTQDTKRGIPEFEGKTAENEGPPKTIQIPDFKIDGKRYYSINEILQNQSGGKDGLKEEIRNSVGMADLDRALVSLQEYDKLGGGHYANEIILLRSRLSALKREELNGTIDYRTASVERAKITAAVLDTVDSIQRSVSVNISTAKLSDIAVGEKDYRNRGIFQDARRLETLLAAAQLVGFVQNQAGKEGLAFVFYDEKNMPRPALASAFSLLEFDTLKRTQVEFNFSEYQGYLRPEFSMRLRENILTRHTLDFALYALPEEGYVEALLSSEGEIQEDKLLYAVVMPYRRKLLLSVRVKSVERSFFDIETEEGYRLPPGCPILDENWKVVGMVMGRGDNKAVKISALNASGGLKQAPKFVLLCTGQDQEGADRLHTHLGPLLRSEKLRWFDKKQILAGENTSRRLEEELEHADYVLCLLSPDFMASSDYDRALKALDSGKKIIPILFKPTLLSGTIFENLTALPGKEKFISKYDDADQAFLEVVKGIEKLL